MARTALIPPPTSRHPMNTADATDRGDSPKTVVDALNTMLTELYAADTAAAAVAAASSNIVFVDVTITTAELLALNATPKTIVAAPGANLALLLVSVVAYKAAGTAYAGIASGEDLAIKYTDSSGSVLATIETTGFLDQATAQVRQAEAYHAASGVNSTTPSNTPIVAHLLVGEITTGDTDLKLRVYYRVIPTVL